jgi:hypothetical protein
MKRMILLRTRERNGMRIENFRTNINIHSICCGLSLNVLNLNIYQLSLSLSFLLHLCKFEQNLLCYLQYFVAFVSLIYQ